MKESGDPDCVCMCVCVLCVYVCSYVTSPVMKTADSATVGVSSHEH